MDSLSITQNFINNTDLLRELISKTGITSGDTVLDLGAGTGVITDALLETGCNVRSIELDKRLYQLLIEKYSNNPQVTVINEDILTFETSKVSYKTFSNIPFNISSSIITKLYYSVNPPVEGYYILQKEAAQRFLGIGEGYLISLLLKPFYSIEILHEFKRNDFTPVPSVDVVLLKIKKRLNPDVSERDIDIYRDFISFVLLQQKPSVRLRLKKVFSHLQLKRIYADLNLDWEVTVKDIPLDKWISIFNVYKDLCYGKRDFEVRGTFNRYRAEVNNNDSRVTRTKIRQ